MSKDNGKKCTVQQVKLDTKAQLGTGKDNSLIIKAKRKYLSSKITGSLATIKTSELNSSYWGSQYCNSKLIADNGVVTSHYCNARWCITCNKIRMAKLLQGYVKPLSQLSDKYFVTLTVPNCIATDLYSVIRKMLSDIKTIMEKLKKRKQRGTSDYQLVGIRKLECTYNIDRNDYHPHFHFIIQGENAANELLKEWLHRNPNCSLKGQDVTKADDKSSVELFKYFAKIIGKNKRGDIGIYINQLDVIFTAMRGLRVFQPFGVIKDVTEDIRDIVSQNLSLSDGLWEWHGIDWCNEDGECASGYYPDENMIKIVNSIVIT